MGGSSAPSTTTQKTEPPGFIKPYLEQGAEESFRRYLSPNQPQFFPGSTVVPFSEPTQRALDLTQQRAVDGSPTVDAAQGYVQNTLNVPPTSQFGNATNPYATNPSAGGNPFLDATFNRAADQVQNRLQSSFAGSGRNIGAARAPAALELNDLANTVYGGAYQQDANRQFGYDQIGAGTFDAERGRMLSDLQQQRGIQLGAAGMAPGLATTDYQDLAALEGVGGRYEDQAGQRIDEQISRFNFDQNAPDMNLDRYLARIQGAFPGQSVTQSTPNTRNRAGGALGGAATGATLGASFGPYGAALGALGGGLLGAFG